MAYLRPFLELIGGFETNGVALVLLVFGAAGFLGTLAAPAFLKRSIRFALTGMVNAQAIFLALRAVLDGSQTIMLGLVALWGFATGTVGVGWSTWLAETYRTTPKAVAVSSSQRSRGP